MFSRLIDRLTYANVVATLALFLALGGAAYAGGLIGSADVRDRSLRGKDMRNNTVKGRQIREASLRRVPEATSAVEAANAQNAILAQTATSAENAATANLANRATDSDAVGGFGASALEKSSRTQFGRATSSPPNPAAAGVVLEWPAMGFQVKAVAQGGCPTPTHLALQFIGTRTSGPTVEVFRDASAAVTTVPPNTSVVTCSDEPDRWNGGAALPDGRTLYFKCREIAGEIRCLGTRSEP